jgi:predicted aspartyl protease
MIKKAFHLFFIVLLLISAVSARVEDTTIRGTIPFDLNEHLILIKGKINGSQKNYNFVLDTGGLTFVDKDVVEELKLKKRGNMAKMNTLEMGEVTVPNIFAFTSFNLEPFKKHGVLIHGIIGSNLLERFVVTLDYRNQKVIFSPDKEDLRENAQSYRCRFTNHRINNAPMIDCTINGNVSLKAMVDTGQPYSIVLPLEYLEKLNSRDNESLLKSKGVIISWPGTKTTDSFLLRLDRFEQKDVKINNLMCYFAELPPLLSVPLLGRDYLSQFLITIDYPRDEILFVPYEDARFVKNMFSFGLNLSKGANNTIVVQGLWTGSPADRAGIKVGDEIVECNSKVLTGDDIFELRQLLEKKSVKRVKFIVKGEKGKRETILQKEMLLDTR